MGKYRLSFVSEKELSVAWELAGEEVSEKIQKGFVPLVQILAAVSIILNLLLILVMLCRKNMRNGLYRTLLLTFAFETLMHLTFIGGFPKKYSEKELCQVQGCLLTFFSGLSYGTVYMLFRICMRESLNQKDNNTIFARKKMIQYSIFFFILSSLFAFVPFLTKAVGPDGLICMITTSSNLQRVAGQDAAVFWKQTHMLFRAYVYGCIIYLFIKLYLLKREEKRSKFYKNKAAKNDMTNKLSFHLAVFTAFWLPWQIYTFTEFHYRKNEGVFQGLSLVFLNAKGIGNLLAALKDEEFRAVLKCQRSKEQVVVVVETEEEKHPKVLANFHSPLAPDNARRAVTANHLTKKEGMIDDLPYFQDLVSGITSPLEEEEEKEAELSIYNSEFNAQKLTIDQPAKAKFFEEEEKNIVGQIIGRVKEPHSKGKSISKIKTGQVIDITSYRGNDL